MRGANARTGVKTQEPQISQITQIVELDADKSAPACTLHRYESFRRRAIHVSPAGGG